MLAKCSISALPAKRTIADQLRTFADQTSHIQRPDFAPLATTVRTSSDQPKSMNSLNQWTSNIPHRRNLSN